MAVPTYEEFMYPLLKVVYHQSPIKKRDYEDRLADLLSLSDEDRTELLPSGTQHKFRHRIGWAATHLKKAGLLRSPVKATLEITDEGKKVLAENPAEITVAFLNRYPDHLAFVAPKSKSNGNQPKPVPPVETDQPPLERLASAYDEYRGSLASDLLDQIMQAPPEFFERLVVEVLVAMGYGGTLDDAGQAIGKSGDGGIDGVIKEDRLGLDSIYIQAKRWENPVSRPVLQAFAGALMGQNSTRGVFITSSDFTSGARDYVKQIQAKIVLIDGQQLAELMIDYGVGVIDEQTYRVKRVDPEYFGE